MRQVRYSVAMSLDGYITAPDGGIDWIVMDPDIDFGALFQRFDTVLMGRKSWEHTNAMGGGGGMPGMASYVFSTTLAPGECGAATVSADPATVIAQLKAAPGKDIWLFGGGELFRSLLDQGLVDVVQVAVIPVMLGGGTPMLPQGGSRATLQLSHQHHYPKTGTMLLEYRIQP